MKLILINPVIHCMYAADDLTAFLGACGYKEVTGLSDWSSIVLSQYADALKTAEQPVVDMRCPRAVEALKEVHGQGLIYPDILPILLQTAREFACSMAYAGVEKVVIAPCQALVAAGEALHLPNLTFMTWADFVHGEKEHAPLLPEPALLAGSPVPPGYFDRIAEHVLLLTGPSAFEGSIRIPPKTNIIEMLYCLNGCHCGDGVLP